MCFAQFGGVPKMSIPKAPEHKLLKADDIVKSIDYLPDQLKDTLYRYCQPYFPDTFKVEYIQINEDSFDKFFLSAAKTDGLSKLGMSLSDSATANLKKYARSHAADAALKEILASVVGNTSPDSLTVDQSMQVEKIVKEKNKMGEDEKKYFSNTTIALGAMATAQTLCVKAANDLVNSGKDLPSKATSLGAPKSVYAADGVKTSMENLKSFVENSPKLIKTLNTLLTGFQSL